ncbi:MAG TPA: SusD/RagB family nutrient-binding outer membrane lipoprotein, partial [Flavisolibacter sp.]|nr:SusD/RagB family nutrient-binding outer membrane lipoprotein [Flavisolibacter sp.]
MKSIIKYVSFLGLGAAIVLSSCQKKLDEAYANPNATTRVPVETLLPSLIGSMLGSSAASGSAYGIAGDALLIGRYIQYWGTFSTTTSPVSYAASNQSNYDVMAGTVGTSDNLGSVWAAHYFGMGANLNRMVEWASEEQKWDFVGAGWALRAWSLLEATNEYGEMPLREAFNASQQVFKYDVQPEIYDSVRTICFRSLSYFNRTDGNMGQKFADADAYFNKGDIGRWKKFVYGILARSYAYISNKQTYSADSVIKYTDLSMTSNADNATLKFAATGISGTSNYFGPFRGNAGTIRQSAFIADLLSGSNPDIFTGVTDPRAPYLLRENPNGTYKGIIPWKGSTGVSAGDLPSNFWGNPYISTTSSTPDSSRYIFRDNAEFPVMTASEMQFLKAEAAYRKNDRTTALAAYV